MHKPLTTDTPDMRGHIIAVGQRIMSGKGFSAVGLNEILTTAGVPKGSFYHYFASKDAFGVALLEKYFEDYLADIDAIFARTDLTAAQGLVHYFDAWRTSQATADCQGKCLVVKLGAEVADLSEPMRLALRHGTTGIVTRLAGAIERGVAEGTLGVDSRPAMLAESLYQLWLGASVMAKITRAAAPFDAAMQATATLMQLNLSRT